MEERKLQTNSVDLSKKMGATVNQFNAGLIIEKLIKIVNAEVGVSEDPGKNNSGKKITEYQRATSLAPGAWPWCAAFTAWALREWLRDFSVQEFFGLKDDEVFDFRCRSARAFDWQKWATNKGFKVYVEASDTKAPAELVKAGDIIIYNFSHIGIAVADQPTLKDRVQVVEGNTNKAGARDSTTGDGVWLKKRNPVEILCIIRMTEKA